MATAFAGVQVGFVGGVTVVSGAQCMWTGISSIAHTTCKQPMTKSDLTMKLTVGRT